MSLPLVAGVGRVLGGAEVPPSRVLTSSGQGGNLREGVGENSSDLRLHAAGRSRG